MKLQYFQFELRSTIKGFMIKFQFFLTQPGAEEVRDGPMVSFAKMMLMISTIRHIIRSNLDTRSSETRGI
jgi:hypothetical protein